MGEQFPYIGNPHAPDVFADGMSGTYLLDGVLRMTFETVRFDPGAGETRRVNIGSLVMPVAAAEMMARTILDNLERHRASVEATVATKN